MPPHQALLAIVGSQTHLFGFLVTLLLHCLRLSEDFEGFSNP